MNSARFPNAVRYGLLPFMLAAALFASVMLTGALAHADTTPDKAHTNPIIIMAEE